MKALMEIFCDQCGENMGEVQVDTADMPEKLQEKVNRVILAHREECEYYR